jgi:hypothetical protein
LLFGCDSPKREIKKKQEKTKKKKEKKKKRNINGTKKDRKALITMCFLQKSERELGLVAFFFLEGLVQPHPFEQTVNEKKKKKVSK